MTLVEKVGLDPRLNGWAEWSVFGAYFPKRSSFCTSQPTVPCPINNKIIRNSLFFFF